MKPTIEAINLAIRQFRDANESLGGNYWYRAYSLAIQALTEMRDRENLYNSLPNSIPKTREELAMYLKTLGIDPTKVIERTWREVTAGEIRDFLVINPRFSWHRIQQPAEAVLSQQPDPLKHWRSIGA